MAFVFKCTAEPPLGCVCVYAVMCVLGIQAHFFLLLVLVIMQRLKRAHLGALWSITKHTVTYCTSLVHALLYS